MFDFFMNYSLENCLKDLDLFKLNDIKLKINTKQSQCNILIIN